jgi:hypothetical protein
VVAVAGAIAWSSSASADDWLPISPEELKMTSDPKAPGALAVNLYRQVDRDDQANRETNYIRIKILTDEGRKYGDVAIPLYKQGEQINNIRARTIRPDGSIVNFDGKIYLRTAAEGQEPQDYGQDLHASGRPGRQHYRIPLYQQLGTVPNL